MNRDDQIIQLFNDGNPVTDICNQLNIGNWVVYKVLKRNGLKPSGSRYKSLQVHNKISINKDDLIKLHSNGKTTLEIANYFDCSTKRIREEFKKYGLKSNLNGSIKSQIGELAYEKLSNKNWLHNKYINQSMSSRDIAREIGCGKKTVLSFIKKHNIKKHDIRIGFDEFIIRAFGIHKDRYDYSKVNYKDYNTEIEIVCNKHGSFYQVPKHHIKNKNGCPKCSGTNSELELYKLVNSIIDGAKYNDRTLINPYEIDMLIRNKNIGIEFNGLYWHSYNYTESVDEKKKHYNKYELCKEKGVQLIQIREDEWTNKRPIVESIIKSKLNKTERIYARKCIIKKLDNQVYKEFINNNHIQGYKTASIKLGLYCYDDELVSCMSFNKHPKYEWEINRFCNKLGYTVVGGASKLFRCFVKRYNPSNVITYADRCYSNGNLYRQLGFKLDGVTNPNYYYVKNLEVFSRQQFQKHKLKDKLEMFDPHKTEAENMFANGYRRIWDAGNYRFIYRPSITYGQK